jgi:hypothetical protein
MTDRDTDRLLLAKAAKAAGLTIRHDIETVDCLAVTDPAGYWESDHMYWNPLTDDGDALRLACDLGLQVYPIARTATGRACSAVASAAGERLAEVADMMQETYSATRRAIVRAAAALGGECAS